MDKKDKDFLVLGQKYVDKTPQEIGRIKRQVHYDSKGSRYGKLVAYGKATRNIKGRTLQVPSQEACAPHYIGQVLDAGSGNTYTIHMWMNTGGSVRFEVLDHTVRKK